MQHAKNTLPDACANAGYSSAAGPVTIRMNNDYLFRALLQSNNNVLRGLICSLLRLAPSQVRSVVIMNPIELGDSVISKDFFLDIKVLLNDSAIINLEMQVVNEHNWVERSLSYLCRSFDNLEHGQSYIDVKASIQIGLLNFTLFPQYPEFYSTYKLVNIKNHILYSDKLCLSVVDLTKIDLATEEDKAYHTDYWASFFKADTWEEIKMLAERDEYIMDASNTIYQLSQEEKIRLQCEAREDYYRRQEDARLLRDRLAAALENAEAKLAEKNIVIAEKDSAIAALQAEIERLRNSRA